VTTEPQLPPMTPEQRQIKRLMLSLMVASIDGDLWHQDGHDIVCADHVAHNVLVDVARGLAEMYVTSFFDTDHQRLRADLVDELTDLADG
jgi:hypothetical protein